jgi:ATP phosphoribosyltransferase regulatory subunit
MRVEPPFPPAPGRHPRAAGGGRRERADAPLLQPLNLLLDLAGEAMRARLFVVQAEGGRRACLRPDFTVAIAREHIEAAAGAAATATRAGLPRPPAATGPEEFVQLGLELFSPANGAPEAADAEIAASPGGRAPAGAGRPLAVAGRRGAVRRLRRKPGPAAALAARLKRVAGRPRLLRAELRGWAWRGTAADGALSGILAGLTEVQARACWKRSGRWRGSSRSADVAPPRSRHGWCARPTPPTPRR